MEIIPSRDLWKIPSVGGINQQPHREMVGVFTIPTRSKKNCPQVCLFLVPFQKVLDAWKGNSFKTRSFSFIMFRTKTLAESSLNNHGSWQQHHLQKYMSTQFLPLGHLLYFLGPCFIFWELDFRNKEFGFVWYALENEHVEAKNEGLEDEMSF